MESVYLDYAAATPVDPLVLRAMEPYFSVEFYNPSSLYSGARKVKQALEDARSSVARSIGARPSEIIFTAGGSESTNLAIRGVVGQHPGCELVVTAVEHDAVLMPAVELNAKIAPVDERCIVDVEKLEQLITDKTVLISVMYVNNEVGTVQPIQEVVNLVKKIRAIRRTLGNKTPLLIHVDACQAPQYLDCNVARLGIDLMTLNGGKIFGPKQSGILYRKSGVLLKPQISGGGQEYGLRSGTENVAACVGFAKALELALERKKEVTQHVAELRQYFAAALEDNFKLVFNGHPKKRLPNTVHVTFPGADNERLLFSLDDQGVLAAAGSACSASSELASHVLLAMGMSEADARSSLRFSLGRNTTKEEIDYTIRALKTALKA